MNHKFFLLACFFPLLTLAQTEDSIRISRLLKTDTVGTTRAERLSFFSKKFIGIPYQAGTLEGKKTEELVVCSGAVDCTTFVEQALALALADSTYTSFKEKLQQIRYKDGDIKGYASRLHYISMWIEENSSKQILKEITSLFPHKIRTQSLQFMSRNAHLYPALKDSPEMTKAIREAETPYQNYRYPYIPKEWLQRPEIGTLLPEGSIVAFVSNKSDLDTVHIGFIIYKNGKPHLLHASQRHKKVLIDPLSLYEYTSRRKDVIGIRIITLR